MIGLKLTMVDDSLDERLDQPVLFYGTEFKIFEQHKKRGDRERTVTIIQQTNAAAGSQVAESLDVIDDMILDQKGGA